MDLQVDFGLGGSRGFSSNHSSAKSSWLVWASQTPNPNRLWSQLTVVRSLTATGRMQYWPWRHDNTIDTATEICLDNNSALKYAAPTSGYYWIWGEPRSYYLIPTFYFGNVLFWRFGGRVRINDAVPPPTTASSLLTQPAASRGRPGYLKSEDEEACTKWQKCTATFPWSYVLFPVANRKLSDRREAETERERDGRRGEGGFRKCDTSMCVTFSPLFLSFVAVISFSSFFSVQMWCCSSSWSQNTDFLSLSLLCCSCYSMNWLWTKLFHPWILFCDGRLALIATIATPLHSRSPGERSTCTQPGRFSPLTGFVF